MAYTEQELIGALRKAHEAGDTRAAQAIARRIQSMREGGGGSTGAAPAKTMEDLTLGISTDPNSGVSGTQRFLAGAGKSLRDTGLGLTQFLAKGGPIGMFLNSSQDVAQWLTGKSESDVQSLISGERRRHPLDLGGRVEDWATDRANANAQGDAALMSTGAGFSGNVAGTAAQFIGPGVVARGTAAAPLLLPRSLMGNVAQGAALGATQPVQDGESRLLNTTVGAGAGAGGFAVGRALEWSGQRAAQAISTEARAIYEAAKARGIDLTPAQLSDSRFLKFMQSMLRSVPFTGAQGRHAQQVGNFNRAVAETIGESAPAVDSQVYAAAKARQSAQFDELTNRYSLTVDNKLIQSLADAVNNSQMAGETVQRQVEAAVEDLMRRSVAGPNGVVIPGAAYQAFDSQIGQILKSGGIPAFHLGRVQGAVREAMDRSIPAEAREAWRTLRQQYGNRKTLAPAVANAADGDISPPRLMGLVTNNRAGKEAMASGTRGELGVLAKIGQRMKEPPSSGTAERTFVGALLGGGAAIEPVTGGAAALGLNVLSRTLDSKTLARVMMRENPGMHRKAAGKYASALVKLMGLQALPVAADEG